MNQCYCGNQAQSHCAKCTISKYCSRDCQLKDWPTHKLTCLTPLQLTSRFNNLLQKISANISQFAKYNSNIEITISETLNDFLVANFYFVHLSGVECTTDGVLSPSATVVIKLLDYSDDFSVLIKDGDYVDPGNHWSILVE